MDLLGQRLKDLRAQKQLYQKELADRLGVARSTVAAWEAGTKRPEGRTLEKLADFFGVTTDYIFGRTDRPQGRLVDPFVGSPESGEAIRRLLPSPLDDLITYLRGHQLTADDVEAVKDLLEARKLRRQREEREQCQP